MKLLVESHRFEIALCLLWIEDWSYGIAGLVVHGEVSDCQQPYEAESCVCLP